MNRRGLLAALLAPGCGAARSPAIDLGGVAPGGWIRVQGPDGPTIIRHRTCAQIEDARRGDRLPGAAPDGGRVVRPEWLVVLSTCPHQGCPVAPVQDPGTGFRCFCHGSRFDHSGRRQAGPARGDLRPVPHRFSGDRAVILDRSPTASADAPEPAPADRTAS